MHPLQKYNSFNVLLGILKNVILGILTISQVLITQDYQNITRNRVQTGTGYTTQLVKIHGVTRNEAEKDTATLLQGKAL